MLAELYGYIPGIFVITMQPRQSPGPDVQVTPTSSCVNIIWKKETDLTKGETFSTRQ